MHHATSRPLFNTGLVLGLCACRFSPLPWRHEKIRVGNAAPPIYLCEYSEALEAVGKDGCYPVPDGPGLGVRYDWDFITRHTSQLHSFG